MKTINLTTVEPKLKHPTVFQFFDVLPRGEKFIIDNDHDPKPLYYQLLAERGQTFEWLYLQQGPDRWKVQITKSLANTSPTIGEIVSKDYRKAMVFKKFGIDFCCGGRKTLTEACSQKNIDIEKIEIELAEFEKAKVTPTHDYASWDLGFLTDYIVNTHHQYVCTSLPYIQELSEKVARVHGTHHPEVLEVAFQFKIIADELSMHMYKEEAVLFPYIKDLAQAFQQGTSVSRPPFGTIANPIRMMEAEHSEVGNALELIERLSNNFSPPTDACSSYTILYARLLEFQKDLHQHIHLENNILFPKAQKLEQDLLSEG